MDKKEQYYEELAANGQAFSAFCEECFPPRNDILAMVSFSISLEFLGV